jgi:DNA (cytosine-5)-methyltransferase 1
MSRPRLLDLFCGAGGAAVGYDRAGFDVVGVDVKPQPHYPFEFVQADAMTSPLDGFDAYHASAPCQDHTPLAALVGTHGTGWLLGAIRERLSATGKPFVLENVPGAPMRPDVILCGHMFGLRTRRHRWFELHGFGCLMPSHVHRPGVLTATSRRRERWDAGWDVSVTGDVGVYVGPEALGIDWMNGNELSQAIPPAYTEYIGRQLMDVLAVETVKLEAS